MSVPTSQLEPSKPPARPGLLKRALARVLMPRWVQPHFIVAPFWLLSVMGLLLSIPVFLIGFCVFTLPHLSYVESRSEKQTVTDVTRGGSCSSGRSTGTRFYLRTQPLPGDRGAGGTFSSCFTDAPTAVGSTVTVFVRNDGSQLLRMNVDTITDDVEDAGYVLGASVAFGAFMSFLNVFRLIHRRRKKPPLTAPQRMIKALKDDHSPWGDWMAADVEYRISHGLPLSDTLTPKADFPTGPPPGSAP